MTKEEAVKEIEKAFEPAFANYIITALTEGATVSDIQHRWGRAYEAGVKDRLEQDPTTKNDLVNEAPAITEQEIAKPYLEKLKTEIEKKHTKAKQTSSVLQMNAYTDCLQMIDNLLSEQEAK